MSEYLSWSETAWATQEERLAVETKGAKLVIGVPKERDMEENRILLNPAAVSVLVQNGHNILVETGAGLLAGWEDRDMQMQVQKLQLKPRQFFNATSSLKWRRQQRRKLE